MRTKYIDNRTTIDLDSVRELDNNGLDGNHRRVLCAALAADHSQTYYYIETNGDPEWLPESDFATDAEAIACFRATEIPF